MKAKRAVARPCDEEIDGEDVRTWDVFVDGQCIASGYATRREAREYAKHYNAAKHIADAVISKE